MVLTKLRKLTKIPNFNRFLFCFLITLEHIMYIDHQKRMYIPLQKRNSWVLYLNKIFEAVYCKILISMLSTFWTMPKYDIITMYTG